MATTTTTTGPSGIVVEDLYVSYGSTAVVRGVSFTVDPGQVVALMGPNGAGKTTTLLAVSGVLPMRSGSVVVNGLAVAGTSTHRVARAGLTHVPERRGLFAQLTVRENIRVAVAGDAGVRRTFQLFPSLEPLAERRAGLLSGGEQQMLAVGRALAMRPRALVIDEMSLGLAPMIVAEILPVLRAVADEGTAVLIVEQHIHHALQVIDAGHVLAGGRIVLSGSPELLGRERATIERSYLG